MLTSFDSDRTPKKRRVSQAPVTTAPKNDRHNNIRTHDQELKAGKPAPDPASQPTKVGQFNSSSSGGAELVSSTNRDLPPTLTKPNPGNPGSSGLSTSTREFSQNERGVSFESILMPWLADATCIIITDPYIRVLHQARNLMELLEMILLSKSPGQKTRVRLRTTKVQDSAAGSASQLHYLERIRLGFVETDIDFEVEFAADLHARHVITDTGWKIVLDRGLDIFQKVPSDPFDLGNRLQEFRSVKAFEVVYIRLMKPNS